MEFYDILTKHLANISLTTVLLGPNYTLLLELASTNIWDPLSIGLKTLICNGEGIFALSAAFLYLLWKQVHLNLMIISELGTI